MAKESIDRRRFMKTTGAAALVSTLPRRAVGTSSAESKRARVVLIRNPAVLDALHRPRRETLTTMLDEAVTALFKTDTAAEAWKGIAGKEDTVGIKSNVWRYLRTPTVLEDLVTRRLVTAGVRRERISVDDRGILQDEVFTDATVLINMRPMRTHHWSGVGSLIKNYIMFVENPWDYHDDSCADLGVIWTHPTVAGRTRLNVLVMLTPLFHGSGPHHFNPEYTWPYAGLIVGTDPVATDSVGLRIIEAKRREIFGKDRPVSPSPKHIALAETRYGLGVADPKRIDIVRLGETQGMLI